MKRLIWIDRLIGMTRVEFKVLYVRTESRSPHTGKRARVFRVLFQVAGQERWPW